MLDEVIDSIQIFEENKKSQNPEQLCTVRPKAVHALGLVYM